MTGIDPADILSMGMFVAMVAARQPGVAIILPDT